MERVKGLLGKLPQEETLLIYSSWDGYYKDPEQVKAKAKEIITVTKGKGIILSSGCALGANTKPENVAALVEAAKLYGTREELEALQK